MTFHRLESLDGQLFFEIWREKSQIQAFQSTLYMKMNNFYLNISGSETCSSLPQLTWNVLHVNDKRITNKMSVGTDLEKFIIGNKAKYLM